MVECFSAVRDRGDSRRSRHSVVIGVLSTWQWNKLDYYAVTDDADLDAAVDGAMLAKMRNMGEACTAANRFHVHASSPTSSPGGWPSGWAHSGSAEAPSRACRSAR